MALAKFGGGCMGGPCQGHGGPRSTDEYHTLKLPPEASPGGTPGRAPGGPPEARALGYGPAVLKPLGFIILPLVRLTQYRSTHTRAFLYKFGFSIVILNSLELATVTTCLTEKMQITLQKLFTKNNNLLR